MPPAAPSQPCEPDAKAACAKRGVQGVVQAGIFSSTDRYRQPYTGPTVAGGSGGSLYFVRGALACSQPFTGGPLDPKVSSPPEPRRAAGLQAIAHAGASVA